jgi:hypothetical protein
MDQAPSVREVLDPPEAYDYVDVPVFIIPEAKQDLAVYAI